MIPPHAASWLKRLGRRLPGRDRRGNVAVIAALCMIPMLLAVGMGIDYTLQKRSQDQLAGIADAAALVAVTPTMMGEPIAQAQTAAQNFWNAQSATVSNVAGVTGTVTVTEPESGSGTSVTRTAVVTWSGTSANSFASLTGMPTSPLKGSSSAVSSRAPSVNFYLLVDTSPSMGIVTSDGISTMMAHTTGQDAPNGCAFACHESEPSVDGTKINNVWRDNYYIAKTQLGLTLRIDEVDFAVSNLLSLAASTATTNRTTYGVSISTMDYQVGQVYQTSNITTPANLSAANTAITPTDSNRGISQLEVAYNNCLTASNCNPNNDGADQNSNLELGLSTMATFNTGTYRTTSGPGYQMYTPGSGTSTSGDTPQEVLFIITDGMDDWYNTTTKLRAYAAINKGTSTDYCAAIKAKGVRIAFLYLYYSPLTTDAWYNTYAAAPAGQIEAAAQACASPGLYQEVKTDTDVSSALANLFQVVVATARLTH